jgi:hypothetical protein
MREFTFAAQRRQRNDNEMDGAAVVDAAEISDLENQP